MSNNNYFGHVEQVLMAMLFDKNDCKLRKKAVNVILKSRKRNRRRKIIRKFKTFPIKMNASSYDNLVDWNRKRSITEPPACTIRLSEDDLRAQVDNPNYLKAPSVPFHTQSVERTVKLITEVSSRVHCQIRRHYEILNALYSRMLMPRFDNKMNFPATQQQ